MLIMTAGLIIIDYWQVCGSLAAVAFTIGFVDQVRKTYKTRNVDGLSLVQWLVFAGASLMFTAYYIHLQQWLMVLVSAFGTVCCLLIVLMFLKYSKVTS